MNDSSRLVNEITIKIPNSNTTKVGWIIDGGIGNWKMQIKKIF
jgi:hypothetical protein